MASVPASYSNVHVNKQNKNMSFLQFCYIKLHPVENFLAYHIPPLSCDYHLYSFFPRTVRDWNILPEAVVRASSPEVFRGMIHG